MEPAGTTAGVRSFAILRSSAANRSAGVAADFSAAAASGELLAGGFLQPLAAFGGRGAKQFLQVDRDRRATVGLFRH